MNIHPCFDLKRKERKRMNKLPESIRKQMGQRKFRENSVGMSGSRVLESEDLVLKIQTRSRETDNEYQICRWLGAQSLPAPEILAYEAVNGTAYSLMTKIKGTMLCDEEYMTDPERLLTLVCQGLNMLWNVDIAACPCDNTLDARLGDARYAVEHNLVDLDNVEEDTFGPQGFSGPEELLRWLETNRPEEEIVFSHGDLSLPNVFADGDRISGFIDLGKTGKADRWQDLAICYRSLRDNFAGRYNGGHPYPGYRPEMLFERLGIRPDAEKLKYYLLLDELF